MLSPGLYVVLNVQTKKFIEQVLSLHFSIGEATTCDVAKYFVPAGRQCNRSSLLRFVFWLVFLEFL